MLKNTELPNGFQRKVFISNNRGEGCGLYDFLLIDWW